MGYSTKFNGELKFVNELTVSQLSKVKSFCGEDCREHPEWLEAEGLYYIDLELTDDFTGLRWDFSEKTCDMEKLVNVIVLNMRQEYPEFSITGEMLAQGEEVGDIWKVATADGLAFRQDIHVHGDRVICPYCEGVFEIKGQITF